MHVPFPVCPTVLFYVQFAKDGTWVKFMMIGYHLTVLGIPDLAGDLKIT